MCPQIPSIVLSMQTLPQACPDQPIRRRGETKTDKQRTRFHYSVGSPVST